MNILTSDHVALANHVFSSIISSVRHNQSDIYSFASDYLSERDSMLIKNEELEQNVNNLYKKICSNFENQYYFKDYHKLDNSDVEALNVAFDIQISKMNLKKAQISALTKNLAILGKIDEEIIHLENVRNDLLAIQH